MKDWRVEGEKNQHEKGNKVSYIFEYFSKIICSGDLLDKIIILWIFYRRFGDYINFSRGL